MRETFDWRRTGIALTLATLCALLFVTTRVDADEAGGQAEELGRVDWGRDYEAAARRAAAEQKPLFLLFQEVPGCSTCVAFGEQVLSHPLLVEAIEDEFVPMAILNNRGGEDRRVLRRFGEPAWNNPVVRFVDAKGSDLLPRRDRIWRPAQIARRMAASLTAAGRPVPGYLAALADELGPQRIERATLAMACYWQGEACLGGLPGLLSSRAAWLEGREVVELRFDASRLDYRALLERARAAGCADGVFALDERQLEIARDVYGKQARRATGKARLASAANQKYHLKRDPRLRARLAEIDPTPAQAARLNHLAWRSRDPRAALSPRQQALLGGSARGLQQSSRVVAGVP